MPTHEERVRLAVTEALETMAFVVSMPGAEGADAHDRCVRAEISLHGDLEGHFILAVPASALASLTADMLDVEEVPSQTEMLDAFGELANVACASAVRAIVGDAPVFGVDPPRVSVGAAGSASDCGGGRPATHVRIPLDGAWVDVGLAVRVVTRT